MKRKKLAAVLTAIAIASVSLAACGGTSAATGDSAGNDSQTEDTSGSGKTAYNVASVRWADWGENYHTGFPDAAAEEAGIDIEWNTIINSDWTDKKAVMMASGDLPDAFMGSICFTESDIMSNLASFIALDDYVDEYMPNFKKAMEEDATMKALAYSSDGHIYGLPAKKPCRPVIANQLFINQTWLDNLGLSMPDTYDEFVDVLRAFKEQDANGNGDPDDEIPYGKGYADSVMFFCLPFGTTIGADNTFTMTVKNGNPVFIPTSDEYKAGINAMSHAYSEGLIDQEIFTEDDSMRDAKLMAETPVVGCAPGWTADATFGANADQYAALPALKGPDGERYVSSDPEHWNYGRYELVVTKSCDNPAPLLAWADKFYTEDASIQNYYGSFGVGVEKNDDGTYNVLEPNDGNSADTFAWINSLRDFGPKYIGDDFNSKVIYLGENGDAAKLALDEDMREYAKDAYPNVSYTVEQLNTLATLYADIETYVSSSQAAWITGGGVDAQWAGYLEQLKAMGYDDFMKIQEDAYETYISNR